MLRPGEASCFTSTGRRPCSLDDRLARFLHLQLGTVLPSSIGGKAPDPGELLRYFGGVKHARYHDPDTVYHGLIRTVQGRFLLRPDDKGRLCSIIAGVLARAQELYPSVRIYADAWLSNHGHLMLQGDFHEVSAFFGFVEREISRRWGPVIGWEGSMFQKFETTALPTKQSQLRALRYVLAQSTKEHLVASPLRWPGTHCAKDLVRGFTRRGIWFDGTGYGRELHKRLAREVRRSPPNRRDFERECVVRFDKLPALAHLSDQQYRERITTLVREIEASAAAERQRTGGRLVGRRRLLRISRETRSALPRPPWFEKRRRMICWADRWAQETVVYLQRYWKFQRAFREASRLFLAGELDAPFPQGAFRPCSAVHAATLAG